MLSEEPSVTLMKTMKKIEKKNSKDKRFLANEMHRQADNLNKKGDYETALILYHRASNLYPHDACHIIAARKIKTSIKNEYLKSDSNIIKYNIDNNSIKSRNLRRKKSNKLFETIQFLNINKLEYLKKIYEDKNYNECLKFGNNILLNIMNIDDIDKNKYKFIIHRYLTLSYMSIGRHDFAINQVSKLFKLSSILLNNNLQLQVIILLGKIHLTFGHLDATIRAFNKLSINIKNELTKAWLFHEIGNCYYEMGLYKKSLNMAKQCCECSADNETIKWYYHGKLLAAQSLIKLGRCSEALETLKQSTHLILSIDDNIDLHNYHLNLINILEKKINQNYIVYNNLKGITIDDA
ncbi:hypothetical protein HCN44_002853 [Aphidius gifuensis]|uniref:Outer dynein arm-docking complex subunit 4 n=1 Tax=Aphidius gifuensis TaxID=684658 RepID=A0A834XV13_APHGI|nr:hypothetical protein HCN44_002853 [Aphidius gifuensis]